MVLLNGLLDMDPTIFELWVMKTELWVMEIDEPVKHIEFFKFYIFVLRPYKNCVKP